MYMIYVGKSLVTKTSTFSILVALIQLNYLKPVRPKLNAGF